MVVNEKKAGMLIFVKINNRITVVQMRTCYRLTYIKLGLLDHDVCLESRLLM